MKSLKCKSFGLFLTRNCYTSFYCKNNICFVTRNLYQPSNSKFLKIIFFNPTKSADFRLNIFQAPNITSILPFNINKRYYVYKNQQSNKDARTYYEILGVSPSASPFELKRAYFEKAKRCHPDRNPGDKTASLEFQKVANAYEVLKNPSSKATYDNSLKNNSFSAAFNKNRASEEFQNAHDFEFQYNSGVYRNVDPYELFRSIWKDLGFKDIELFVNDIKKEALLVVNAIRLHNNYAPAWEFAKKRKGLVFGILLPLAAFFRFPALFTFAFRIMTAAPLIFVQHLIRTNPKAAWTLFHSVWFKIVRNLDEKNKRKK